MTRGPIPIQVRARDKLLRDMPDSLERAFILRWLGPKADKAAKKAAERATNTFAGTVDKMRREAENALRKADKFFSILVRTAATHRGPDNARWGRCVTCPPDAPFKHFAALQAGHFISRRYFGTRWTRENVHPQCEDCNKTILGNGRRAIHEEYIEQKHGRGTADRLRRLARDFALKPRREQLVEMAAKFKEEIRKILAEEIAN